MKKAISAIVALSLLVSILLTGEAFGFLGAADAVVKTVSDDEKGWVNDEIRYSNAEKTILNNSVFVTEAETKPYDKDGDNFLWHGIIP